MIMAECDEVCMCLAINTVCLCYHITLKDVRLGPRATKSSDIKQEEILDLSNLKLRVSDNLFNNSKLATSMKISLHGKLDKDNFWGFLVKNIRKIDKI